MSRDSPTNGTAREISIFWDYENVPLPDGCNAAVAAKAIVDAVSHYGRIVDRRLYFDFQKFGGPQDSSGLDSSGFDLVNTVRSKVPFMYYLALTFPFGQFSHSVFHHTTCFLL